MSHAASLPLTLPARARILKWLVTADAVVLEDAPVAELLLFDEDNSRAPTRGPFLAPISGRMRNLASIPSEGGVSIAGVCAHIEYCTHAIIFSGLCSICAANMSHLPPRTRALWESTHSGGEGSGAGARGRKRGRSANEDGGGGAGASLLPTGMRSYAVRQGYELAVADAHAAVADESALSRLRARRKLSLLLDLDHTLVHTTDSARAAELFGEVVGGCGGGVRADVAPVPPPADGFSRTDIFHFSDDAHATRYFVKMRPGLREFLAAASALYELHVDTAATRAYALAVVAHLDPTGALFGDRIVSRCDVGKFEHKRVQWAHRSLRDDSMSVIVDDTVAVWKGSRCLVSIEPYIFWRLGRDAPEVNNHAGRSMTDTGVHVRAPQPMDATATGVSPAVYAEESHVYLGDTLRVLQGVHSAYYSALDSAPASPPSTGTVIAAHIGRILEGCCFVFSGVYPVGTSMEKMVSSALWRNVVAFGGVIAGSIDATRVLTAAPNAASGAPLVAPSTLSPTHEAAAAYDALSRFSRKVVTHVVARSGGTAKVSAALRDSAIRVVPIEWLEESLRRYERQDEGAFTRKYLPAYTAAASRAQEGRVADLALLLTLMRADSAARANVATDAAKSAPSDSDDSSGSGDVSEQDEEVAAGEGDADAIANHGGHSAPHGDDDDATASTDDGLAAELDFLHDDADADEGDCGGGEAWDGAEGDEEDET